MSNLNDFIIENGVLEKYTGNETEVTIPDGVTSIGNDAFICCGKLTAVNIPDSVTSIGEDAFRYCISLKEISIPDSVNSIGSGAFKGCESLSSVRLPAGLTSIGERTFFFCPSLEDLTVPDSVNSIGNFAFSSCKNLRSITLPAGLTSIGEYAFSDCSHLESLTVPDSVNSIGSCAFKGCESLSSVRLPADLTSIGSSAFNGCESLSSVRLPADLTSIGSGAFAHCSHLESLTIPEKVTSVGEHAFLNCRSIKKLSFLTKNVNITGNALTGTEALQEIEFADGFFETKEKLTVAFLPFVKEFSAKATAYIYLFQDSQWAAKAIHMSPDENEVAVMMAEIIPEIEKMTPARLKRITDFFAVSENKLSEESVNTVCEAVLKKDEKAHKKLMADPVMKKLTDEDAEADEPEAEEPVEVFSRSLLEKRPLHPDAVVFKKGIKYAGSDKTCSPQLLNILVSEFLYMYDEYQKKTSGEMGIIVKLFVPKTAKMPEDADKIAAALNREELSDLLEGKVWSCSKTYRLFMYAYARYATEKSVRKLCRHAPDSSPAKVRYWKENFEQALLFSETKAAVDFLEKKGLIDQYIKIRGMNLQEFRDKYSLPKWNMKDGCIISEADSSYIYEISPDFSLIAKEKEGGKVLRSISAKKSPEAAAEFKALKKEASAFYEKRIEYIRAIYISEEKITLSHWNETYFLNPVLKPVTEKVIWSDAAGVTFMCENERIFTSDGADYSPEEAVKVAHVLDMTEEQVSSWQAYLSKKGISLLIEQVWEPVSVIKDVTVFEKLVLSREDRNTFKRNLARKLITVRSEFDYGGYDHRAASYVFSDTGEMKIGRVMSIRYEVNKDTDETILHKIYCDKEKMSRELNTVLFELARACVRSAILQGKEDILTALLQESFTAAQIMEFIQCAETAGHAGITSQLLEYKNKNCPDFDPLAQFVLD